MPHHQDRHITVVRAHQQVDPAAPAVVLVVRQPRAPDEIRALVQRHLGGVFLVCGAEIGARRNLHPAPADQPAQQLRDRAAVRLGVGHPLLCGRVDKSHPWRGRLEGIGVDPAHLDELATGEAKPDLIGINHYVTSDRFLDHRTSLYPSRTHGGNGRDSYADIEAARAELDPAMCGWEPRR